MNQQENDYYITVFSLKLYKILKRHNIFPTTIEPNRRFPEFNVFKYKDEEEVRKIIDDYRKTKKEV